MKLTVSAWLFAAVAAIGLATGNVARAAEPEFEDTFEEFDPTWGQPDEALFVQDGVMVAKVPSGFRAVRKIYQGMIFEDVDVSTRVRQVAGENQGLPMGIVFWAGDHANFYFFGVSANGHLSVQRLINEKWLHPIPWRESDALNKGLDEWNELRVVTSGKEATLYVNGEEILKMKGQPPSGGTFIGFDAWSSGDESLTFEFDFIRVQ